jgi:hypothetical protein
MYGCPGVWSRADICQDCASRCLILLYRAVDFTSSCPVRFNAGRTVDR